MNNMPVTLVYTDIPGALDTLPCTAETQHCVFLSTQMHLIKHVYLHFWKIPKCEFSVRLLDILSSVNNYISILILTCFSGKATVNTHQMT